MQRVGIIGGTGYTGEELLRVLARHENVELSFASEIEPGQKLKDIFPYLPRFRELALCSTEEAVEQEVDLVFLCLPAGESAKISRLFVDRKVKVIDLGADFRFDDLAEYRHWYDMDHPQPQLLHESTYGLPEWNRDVIKTSQIVGNPGCYPTSVLLAVLPFLRAGIVADSQIIVDAKSGVSGAGKTPSPITHYVESNESLMPYKVGRVHRHVGEMEQELSKQADRPIHVLFTPHLVPMSRGILSSIYFRVKMEIAKSDLLNILNDVYNKEPFVHVLKNGLPATKLAVHSNLCFLGIATIPETDYIVVFSAIDNLGKGASWQAVQNMNVMLDFPETIGLLS